jgi:SAM-dependent methyltransferase
VCQYESRVEATDGSRAGSADRLRRERSFHDERFHDDSARAAAGRFYSLARGAGSAYAAALATAESGWSALEYGAGTGGEGFALASRGVRVTGIDISPVAVGKANEAALANGLTTDRCHYVEMDAEHLDFDDRSFDLVFGSGILHHLDLEVALAEVSRVLTHGGSAVFFEPMGHNPAINLYRRLTPAMRTPDEHPLRVEDLRTAGRFFGTVVAEYHVLASFAAIPFRRLRRYPAIVDRLNRIDTAAFRRLPGLGRFAWIVVLHLSQPRAIPQHNEAGR